MATIVADSGFFSLQVNSLNLLPAQSPSIVGPIGPSSFSTPLGAVTAYNGKNSIQYGDTAVANYFGSFQQPDFGAPLIGTVTRIDYNFTGFLEGPVISFQNLSIPLSTIQAYWASGDDAGLLSLLIGTGSTFIANGAGDQIALQGGNNTAYLAAGSGAQTDQISGGGGPNDVAVANSLRLQTIVSGTSEAGAAIVSGGTVTDISGFDTLRFIDGTLAYGTHTPAAEAYRLYVAALGRTPDPAGLGAFTAAISNGTTITDAAQALLSSPEYTAKFGSPSNGDFVTLTFENILGRTPDAIGFAAYTTALVTHALSRAQVLVDVSESSEAVNNTVPQITGGIWAPDPTAVNVLAYYEAALNRLPDALELSTFVQARNFGLSESAMAQDFASSPEFTSVYGSLSNTDFVNTLYKNVLGRVPDLSAGNWIVDLNLGYLSRAQVLTGFADSPELMTRLLPDYAAGIKTSG